MTSDTTSLQQILHPCTTSIVLPEQLTDYFPVHSLINDNTFNFETKITNPKFSVEVTIQKKYVPLSGSWAWISAICS